MAVAAIIAMRHHEFQIDQLAAEERASAMDFENEDIYAVKAKELEIQKKKTKQSSLLMQAFQLCSCKFNTKVQPKEAKEHDSDSDDDQTVNTVEKIKMADDYFCNPAYWESTIPKPFIYYLHFSHYCFKLLNEGTTFNNLITLTIIIAGINVGIQTYPDMDTNVGLMVLDNLILAIFSVEIIVKLVMQGLRPDQFFIGPEWAWNNFDLVVVLLSFPIWGLEGGSSIALLRLVRLARLGKIFNKIPALKMIIEGLLGGIKSVGYIMILLFLVFYLYGVAGFMLFSVNDPFHFGTVLLAMLTLFRLATLENWGDIMFLNIFGCDTYTDMYVGPEDETPQNQVLWCRYPDTSYVLGPLYFVSFIVVAAMVMLSLFIGAVTISMTESMMELKEMQARAKAAAAVAHNMKRMETMMKKQGGTMQDRRKVRQNEVNELTGIISEEEEEPEEEDDPDSEAGLLNLAKKYPYFALYYWWKIRELRKVESESEAMKDRIALALSVAVGIDQKDIVGSEAARKRKKDQDIARGVLGRGYYTMSVYCRNVVESAPFSNFMTVVIIAASINVGLQTEKRIVRYDSAVDALTIADTIILVFFTMEVVLKIIAEAFQPLHYFRDSWNIFDFIIVVGSYIPGAGSSVVMLRLLRLLRVLKLVKRFPQLAVIINALLNGMQSIAYVGLVLVLFFYVFAIIGMLLFSENDPWHFGLLHMAILSLFQAATLDDWTILMYVNQYGCDKYAGVYEDFPEQCKNPKEHGIVAVLYFVLFILLGAQVLLSLFIGVISTSMDEAQEQQKSEQELDERIAKTAKRLLLAEDRVEAMRYVFESLDLDKGGTIEEEELTLGLDAINANMSTEDINMILEKISPNGQVDLNGFILFMYETPMFSKSSAVAKITSAFVSTESATNRKKKKRGPLMQKMVDIFYYFGTKYRIQQEELEAALIIQDFWFDCRQKAIARTNANLIIKNEQELELRRRRTLQDSLSGKDKPQDNDMDEW